MDLSGSQMGDVQHRDTAGGNIVNQGMDPSAAFAFIKEHIWRMDQERERRDGEISARLDRLADTLDAYQIMSERRREADNARTRRHIRLLYALCALIFVVALVGVL